MTNHPSTDSIATKSLPFEPENPRPGVSPVVSSTSQTARTLPLRKKRKKRPLQAPAHSEHPESLPAIKQWRKKDNRIWSDEEAVEFPNTFFYNLHQEEWEIKAQMAQAVRNYLYHEAKSVYSVLDVGCGCGWFSNVLSDYTKGSILGLDLDAAQIDQARRLFAKENLAFRRGDFYQARLRKNSFDYIVLIDVHQWLGPIEQITARANSLLTPGGELHILSTSLPTERNIPKQKEEFLQYCADKMMDSVPQHLHWSSKEDFITNGFEELNRPSLLRKLFRKKNSGAWMRLYAGKRQS